MNAIDSNLGPLTSATIAQALVSDRLRDKYQAIEALDECLHRLDESTLGTLRSLLIKALREDFYAGRERELEDPSIAFTRSWLLSALARVSKGDDDVTDCVLKHFDAAYEENEWARYWALEGLIRGENPRLPRLAATLATRVEDPIVSMLATAYLGSQKDTKAIRRLRDALADGKTQWFALRALRVISLPAAVQDVCKVVDGGLYSDEMFDAVIALGAVPNDSSHAQSAAHSLVRCIVKLRGSPGKDGMRIGAIMSLGKLKADSAAPVLLDELLDDNPGVVREAVRSMERILGLRVAVGRIVEAATKRPAGLDGYGRALGWLDRAAAAEELGALMVSGSVGQQELARKLLSELGGAAAFEKLRARTDAMKQYADVLERAEEGVRALFDRSVREAQNGFHVAVTMDVVVFALGIALLVVSAGYALAQGDNLSSWAGVGASGGVGLLGVLYGSLIAKPRQQVRQSVDHLMRLKITFLAYLRRLHQADQAYTRRMLDDERPSLEEVQGFSDVVERIMDSTLEQTEKLRRSPPRNARPVDANEAAAPAE